MSLLEQDRLIIPRKEHARTQHQAPARPSTAEMANATCLRVIRLIDNGTIEPKRMTPNQNIIEYGPSIRDSAPTRAAADDELKANVHKGKDREKFSRFRPQSRTATPEHFVCRNLSRDHHQFDGTNSRGHTGHDPQQRNQSGVPERDTNGLRKQKPSRS
mgnify:CR=1 FL=1